MSSLSRWGLNSARMLAFWGAAILLGRVLLCATMRAGQGLSCLHFALDGCRTHEVVPISLVQMDCLCGNALELRDARGVPVMAMSTQVGGLMVQRMPHLSMPLSPNWTLTGQCCMHAYRRMML